MGFTKKSDFVLHKAAESMNPGRFTRFWWADHDATRLSEPGR
jgi:hypothetical protein